MWPTPMRPAMRQLGLDGSHFSLRSPRSRPLPGSMLALASQFGTLNRVGKVERAHGVSIDALLFHRQHQHTPTLFRRPYSTSPNPTPLSPSPRASSPKSTPATLDAATRRQLRRLQAELLHLRSRLPPAPRHSNIYLLSLLVLATLLLSYEFVPPVRRGVIAADRCIRVGWAVARCVVDYKMLFRKSWDDTEEGRAIRHQDYEDTHTKCAERIRDVLRKNGGIYIKLGQHLSSVQLIPPAWASAMVPLQDQCTPSSLSSVQALFLSDAGAPLSTFFSTFDENPIGVASLAQVHVATERKSGKKVAVKVMHPDLEEFCYVDMKTTTFMLKVVKSIFPTFEFTWLGEEMEQNLPLEMDFRHEASNAARCTADFATLPKTSLVVPEVLWSKKRVMVMEFIEGKRIDDLAYLEEKGINRNEVAKELSRIWGRMIYLTGFFHADPHGGNLLIRPAQPGSRSPFNFEIVLLDHGLYFDLDSSLRLSYAHLWLSLLAPSTPQVEADRRKYAFEVGNIDASLYEVFQSAITGRAGFGLGGEAEGKSIMEMTGPSKEEAKKIRNAVVASGMMERIFDLLRRVPRRLLMVLKVNDLTRALDASLHPTHSSTRIFLILAQYCALSVYIDTLQTLSLQPFSFSKLGALFRNRWEYEKWHWGIGVVEIWEDSIAKAKKWGEWFKGGLKVEDLQPIGA